MEWNTEEFSFVQGYPFHAFESKAIFWCENEIKELNNIY